MMPLLATFPMVSCALKVCVSTFGNAAGRGAAAENSKPTGELCSVRDRGHCSLPFSPLLLRDASTVDLGLPVPTNSVILQALMGVMVMKGKKHFVREQRQGKVFLRMTLAVGSVSSQGLGGQSRHGVPQSRCALFLVNLLFQRQWRGGLIFLITLIRATGSSRILHTILK